MAPSFSALVPMKHESERVPGKNLRSLHGRPLYHWILETLKASRFVREIVVNTDSKEIARDAAERFGARILWRPDHLLGHMVGIKPLIEYDLSQSDGEYFLQTHSTNPLLTTETVDRAIATFLAPGDHDSLFTVTPVQSRFYWADGKPVNHDPDNLVRTQDLPPVYEENSCLYLFTRAGFLKHRHRIGRHAIMFPMPAEEAVDIDEPRDFTVADALMKARLEKEP
jgi:N-acylneuraminate cytidylyltransferase